MTTSLLSWPCGTRVVENRVSEFTEIKTKLTDPDSPKMANSKGVIQGYAAQGGVDSAQQVMCAAKPYTLAIFGSGPRDDSAKFREEISIQVNSDGSVVYAHAWGLPGGNFEDRSSCSMVPSVA